MSITNFVLARFGSVFAWGPQPDGVDLHMSIAAARRATAAGVARRKNRFLAAIEAHTRRQIELALGERIAEFNQAIRANRTIVNRNEAPSPAAGSTAAPSPGDE